MISIELNKKESYVTLNVIDKNPYISSKIAHEAEKLLQESIIDYKIKNIKSVYDFTLNQLEIAKINLYKLQDSIAYFKDSNKNIKSDLFLNQLNRIETEYNFTKNIYNELVLTKEKTAIEVKRNTPIFTIINPVVIPNEKFEPKRTILVFFSTFIAFIVSLLWIIIKETVLDFYKLLIKR